MSEPFIGEIRMFPYTFAPEYWAYCSGQLLQISQHDVLYAIIADHYGGDGRSTMALPNLQGRIPMHAGQAPGLHNHVLAQFGGFPNVKIYKQHMPSHNHEAKAVRARGTAGAPEGTLYPAVDNDTSQDSNFYHAVDANMDTMASDALASVYGTSSGDVIAHENRQPYMTIPFCIALEGVFPPRN